MRCHKPLSFWMMTFMRVPCLRGVADELTRSVVPPWLTFTSSRPSQCLSRISVCSFLSSPLIVLSKRLKLTRNVLVRHCLGRPEYGPCRFQIFFAQHFALHNPGSNGITPSNYNQSQRDGPDHCTDVHQCPTFV